MNDTILHKLLKWIVASSVSLLAIPISVFVIIFSLYPDLVTINEFSLFKLSSYYAICDVDNNGNHFISENPDTLFTKIISEKHNSKFHLLVIDQTLSTLFKNENNFSKFRSDLQDYFRERNILVIDSSLKSLIYAKLIESLKIGFNCDSLYVFYYDGTIGCLSEKSEFHQFKDIIITDFINNKNHTSGEKANEQKTNFKDIFDKIAKVLEQHPAIDCITFLSDFYHDGTYDLTKNDFEQLKAKTQQRKINLIALWQNKYVGNDADKREICQKKFIDRFNKYFQRVISTDKIFIDSYHDGSYNNNSGGFLEFDEAISFNSLKNDNNIENDSLKIYFFLPISNSLKYNEAQVKIVLNTLGKFRWKIKSISDNNKTFIKFRNNCDVNDTKRYTLNQWYSDACDSLWLAIKLDNNCNYDDLKFCYVVQNSNAQNNFFELNMELKQILFSNGYKKILIYIINIFSGLLLTSIVVGSILFFHDFFQYTNNERSQLSIQLRNIRDIYWCLGMLLLIGILILIICFVI